MFISVNCFFLFVSCMFLISIIMLDSTVTVGVWMIETIGHGYHNTLVRSTSDILDRERRLYAATCQALREAALVYYLLMPIELRFQSLKHPEFSSLSIQPTP